MLLDNDSWGESFPQSAEGRKVPEIRRRAVLMGQVWSADLAETLMEVYSHLLADGYSLEDVSRLVMEPSHDRAGD